MMSRVLLVRHAEPEIIPAQPSELWTLSAKGRTSARELALKLGPLNPGVIVVSPESKAWQTGAEIAAVLDLGTVAHEGLREQSSGTAPWFDDPFAFKEAVRDHFARRDEIVLGDESVRDAAGRMQTAVDETLASHDAQGVPVFVTHGRILSAWVTTVLGEPERAFEIWSELRLPDALLVDIERRTVQWIRGGR
jgi:broad specificity phosphatase PhoE